MKPISFVCLAFLAFQLVSIGCIKSKTVLDIGDTVYNAYASLKIHQDCCKTYENLMGKLKDLRVMVAVTDRMGEQPILPNNLLDDIQQSWVNLGNFFKNDPAFNKKNLLETVLGKKSTNDMKTELRLIESKLQDNMMTRVKEMVQWQLVRAGVRTMVMIKNIKETYELIKHSTQYRESTELQLALNNSKQHLDQAEKFYRIATDRMNPIDDTFDINIQQHQFDRIAFDLNRSQLECEKAEQTVANILKDIQLKMNSLISAKKDYGSNIITSVLDLTVTVIEYATTPTHILSTAVKTLFATKAGFESLNIIGHSVGFYWTVDEITQLENNQNVFKELNTKVKDLFDKINYGLEKLDEMKHYLKSTSQL